MIYYVRHILIYVLNYDCDDIISKIHLHHRTRLISLRRGKLFAIRETLSKGS